MMRSAISDDFILVNLFWNQWKTATKTTADILHEDGAQVGATNRLEVSGHPLHTAPSISQKSGRHKFLSYLSKNTARELNLRKKSRKMLLRVLPLQSQNLKG